jgi:uncharacterized integral membrane protein
MWLKIKVWTKVVVFGLVLLYSMIFILANKDGTAKFWYWFGREPEWPVLFLVLGAFITGVILTVLLRTTFKTLRQFRELQSRSRADKLHREMEMMKTKAAMLRTRDGAAAGEVAAGGTTEVEAE